MTQPLQKMAEGPDFTRWAIGDVGLTWLRDGALGPAGAVLRGDPQARVDAAFAETAVAPEERIAIGAYCIEARGRRVLVDTGCGSRMYESAGRLARSLEAAGIALSSIETILLSHPHPDHVGGLLDEAGGMRFPQAQLRLHQADIAFFLDSGANAALPPAVQKSMALIRDALSPYRAALVAFEAGEEVVPGIRAVPLPGHTPGHSGFQVDTGGPGLFLWGDIVHAPKVQMADPAIGVMFDFDAAAARDSRLRALTLAAEQGMPVGGMHFGAPGLGRVVRRGDGFSLEQA